MFEIFKKKRAANDEVSQLVFLLFGFYPIKTELYEQALSHKSAFDGKDLAYKSNERLEFLGDSILGAIVSDVLYQQYPKGDEGFLSKLRSKIVSRKQLNAIAEKANISLHITTGTESHKKSGTVGGNAVEALIGACYLDKGYGNTTLAINHLLKRFVDIPLLEATDDDYKSQLLIWAQRKRKKLSFQLVKEAVVNREKWYTMHALINGEEYGEGKGLSKKKAEQEASSVALARIGDGKD